MLPYRTVWTPSFIPLIQPARSHPHSLRILIQSPQYYYIKMMIQYEHSLHYLSWKETFTNSLSSSSKVRQLCLINTGQNKNIVATFNLRITMHCFCTVKANCFVQGCTVLLYCCAESLFQLLPTSSCWNNFLVQSPIHTVRWECGPDVVFFWRGVFRGDGIVWII